MGLLFCGGCVGGRPTAEQKAAKRRLEEQARQDYAAANEKVVVLLLGTAESGKSTIFKQIKVRCDESCTLAAAQLPVVGLAHQGHRRAGSLELFARRLFFVGRKSVENGARRLLVDHVRGRLGELLLKLFRLRAGRGGAGVLLRVLGRLGIDPFLVLHEVFGEAHAFP